MHVNKSKSNVGTEGCAGAKRKCPLLENVDYEVSGNFKWGTNATASVIIQKYSLFDTSDLLGQFIWPCRANIQDCTTLTVKGTPPPLTIYWSYLCNLKTTSPPSAQIPGRRKLQPHHTYSADTQQYTKSYANIHTVGVEEIKEGGGGFHSNTWLIDCRHR